MTDARSPSASLPASISLAASLLLLVATLDYVTGSDYGFFVFYYGPIAYAAWQLGRAGGLAAAALSIVAWFIVELGSGNHHPSASVAAWNTLIRLAAFALAAWGVARIRELILQERAAAEELRRARAELKVLEGIVPICASCKKIRDKERGWQPLETYIAARSHAQFSHGLCPDCARQCLEEARMLRHDPSG